MLLGSEISPDLARLYVVRTGDLVALTQTGPLMVERLAGALTQRRVLRHPLLATRLRNGWLVLDGNARLAAARLLGLPDLLIQEVPRDRIPDPLLLCVQAVRSVGDEEILRVIGDVFRRVEEPTQGALRLCLTTGEEWQFPSPADRPLALWEAYRRVVAALRSVADVEPLAGGADLVAGWPGDARAVVIPPPLPVPMLDRLAEAGVMLPTGALGTSLPRRILGLDLSLEVLFAPEPPSEKTAFVRDLVRLKLSQHRVHYYDAPVYIFEE